MIYSVKIDPQESLEVEELFYRYNSYVSILAYLHNNGNCLDSDFLNKQMEETSILHMQLQKVKDKYSQKYLPNEITSSYTYTFDFRKEQLIYEVADEK